MRAIPPNVHGQAHPPFCKARKEWGHTLLQSPGDVATLADNCVDAKWGDRYGLLR